MKKIILLSFVIMLSFTRCYSQYLLGKTKTQVKTEILKTTDDIASVPYYGYDRFWWGNKNIDCYTYFNNKGICFLELSIVSLGVGKGSIEMYLTDPKFHTYIRHDGSINGVHEFVEGKITVEVFTRENYYKGTEYYFYFYKSQDKAEIVEFFNQYYKELAEWKKN